MERVSAREELEQDEPDRVDVSRRGECLAADLLRREVPGSSDMLAELRSSGSVELRKTEVDELHLAVRTDQDVVRLDVAVQNIALVRTRERLRKLEPDVHDVVRVERGVGQHIAEVGALDQLERQIRHVVRDPAVEQSCDVRVVELRDDPRLMLQEPHGRVAFRRPDAAELLSEDLEADELPMPGSRDHSRLERLADRAPAEHVDELVLTYAVSWGERRTAHGRLRSADQLGFSWHTVSAIPAPGCLLELPESIGRLC